MAGLRFGRASCIRAAFGVPSASASFPRRQRNALRRLKASRRRSHVDFVEGIWREFLDPWGGWEDAAAHLTCSFKDCVPGEVTCHRPFRTKSGSLEVHSEDPLSPATPGRVLKAVGGARAPLGDQDVDMQPVEAGGPGARAWAAGLSAPPGVSGVTEESRGPPPAATGPSDTGRRAQRRARVSRTSPKLGSDKDKGPRRSLSKRKLELLLSEPEKRKRKKQYVA